jgi:hypothetical protein
VKTVAQIAEMFGVTTMGVRYWLQCGLPYQKERIIGVKARTIIDPKDVVKHLNLSKEEAEKYIGKEG